MEIELCIKCIFNFDIVYLVISKIESSFVWIEGLGF